MKKTNLKETMQPFSDISISPTKVLAGDSEEFTIKLVADCDFSTDNTAIVLDVQGMLGNSRPTIYMQEMKGFVDVQVSNPDTKYVKMIYDTEACEYIKGVSKSFLGYGQRYIVIRFTQSPIKIGDEIIIKWGFTRNGMGCGTGITTVAPMQNFTNNIYIRYFECFEKAMPDLGREIKGLSRPVPQYSKTISYKIMQRDPKYIRVIPRVNGNHDIMIRDKFHNPCQIKDSKEVITECGKGEFNVAGNFIVPYTNGKFLPKNYINDKYPLTLAPSPKKMYKDYNIYFGDMHCHSAISNDSIERERMEIRPDAMFSILRDCMALDFAAIADHHQPWDIERNKIGESNWYESQKAVQKYTVDKEFIAFSAYEYRELRGDTVVIFGHDMDYDVIDNPEHNSIENLWIGLNEYDYITIPHFHNPGSMAKDGWVECNEDKNETVLEIFSCHGSYEKSKDECLERKIPDIKHHRPDRNGKYFLQRGYKYGYVCNSDNHKGNPGNNGLTAVLAKDLSRKSILEAIRERRCYGTTNARIILVFTIDDNIMGSVLNDIKIGELKISVRGENTIKAVDIYKDGEEFKRYYPNSMSFEHKMNIDVNDKANYYIRVIQIDNHMAWSSPIWIE